MNTVIQYRAPKQGYRELTLRPLHLMCTVAVYHPSTYVFQRRRPPIQLFEIVLVEPTIEKYSIQLRRDSSALLNINPDENKARIQENRSPISFSGEL